MIKGISYALYFSLATGIVGILVFNDIPTMTAFLKSFLLGLLVYITLSVSGVLIQYVNDSCRNVSYEILT
jgi:hypothetical protein